MSDHREVGAAEAIAITQSGDAMLLDVREQPEWDRGHSPLATLLPMSVLRERLAEVPADRRILVLCHSGQRSARVAAALEDAGYDAESVAGGMIAWNAAGGELVADDGRSPQVD